LLGVGEDEVRQELQSLLNGSPADKGAGATASAAAAPPVVAPKTPLSAAKKTTTKKR
jgi:hypothetical protein